METPANEKENEKEEEKDPEKAQEKGQERDQDRGQEKVQEKDQDKVQEKSHKKGQGEQDNKAPGKNHGEEAEKDQQENRGKDAGSPVTPPVNGPGRVDSRLEDESSKGAPHPDQNTGGGKPSEESEENATVSVKVKGNRNRVTTIKFRDLVTNHFGRKEKTLIECLIELPGPPLTAPTLSVLHDELQVKVETLRGERLLFVSCSDLDLAFSASWAIVDNLAIPQLLRRLLPFGRVTGVDFPVFSGLLSTRIHPHHDAIVVVNASDERAQTFVGSLFQEDSVGYLAIREDLRKKALFVICLVKPESLVRCPKNRHNEPLFECWTISHQQYLLRQHCPDDYVELDSSIEEQRRKGLWSSDESEFQRQITTLLEQGQLHDVVKRGGNTVPNQASDFPENPLHMAVLYTATYYPNLSPYEFRGVLKAIVGEEKMLSPKKIPLLQRERLIAEVWMEEADKTLRDCRLVTSDEPKRGITFADIGRRDHLRRYFDEHYGLYVQSRFATAYDKNLLFDPAEQIAKGLILVTLDMARSYPGQFGVEWVYNLIVSAQEYANGPERVADLLRAFLRESDLDTVVGLTMKRLFDGAKHAEIYELCERLRFTPGFDVLPMIRRLIDEGNEQIRGKALRYVRREFWQSGRIYPILRILETWLPDRSEEPGRYSTSAIFALQYVFMHYLEATGEFDDRDRGSWPTSFPLLAVVSDSARDELTLLLRWLLHPQLQLFAPELPDRFHRYLPALIAEWTFFLFGEPAGGRSEELDSRVLTADSLTAEAAWTLLLEQLVELTGTDRERQQSLLFEWETMRTVFALTPSIVSAGVEREIRREYAWKRNLVRKLIGEFRRLQRELKSPSSQRARATV